MNHLTPEEEEDLRRMKVLRQTAENTYAEFPTNVDVSILLALSSILLTLVMQSELLQVVSFLCVLSVHTIAFICQW